VVGCDAAADLREAAGTAGFDLPTLLALAELAGAGNVRLTLSEELHPVSESDLRALGRVSRGLELRMPPIPVLVKSALEARPERVLLASAPRDGRRTAPIDFQAWGDSLPPVVRTLEEAGIAVAVSVSPSVDAVKFAHAADAAAVELFTGSLVDLPPRERAEALDQLGDSARLASKLGMRVGVGGRLDDRQLLPVLEAAPIFEWAAVGRAWIGRSMLVGVDRATRDLRDALG
jgi:pyridoxine 5'-phosphate synthase PdxJ